MVRPAKKSSAECKVLVLGFSVTGDPVGYVEHWTEDFSARRKGFAVSKIGIGGLQPPQWRHLVRSMLEAHRPDIAIFEMATPFYRLVPKSDRIIKEHFETIDFLVSLCSKMNILCGVLDLPQDKIDHSTDWMDGVHRKACEKYGISMVTVPMQDGIMRDNVHPNDDGRKLYAKNLDNLILRVSRSSNKKYSLASPNRSFEAYLAADTSHTAGVIADFERNGYKVNFVELSAGQSSLFKFPKPALFVGVVTLMGPKTGYMDIRIDSQENIICCYDMYCYYNRLGGKRISPSLTDEVVVVQGKVVPEIEPLKGKKDGGPRSGGISHFLYEVEVTQK